MLKEQIAKLLDQFAQEELGNRLSQFSMMSLRGMMMNIVDQHLVGLEQAKAAEEKKKEKAVEGKAPKEEKTDG